MHPLAPDVAQHDNEGGQHPEPAIAESPGLQKTEQVKHRAETFDPFDDPNMVGSFAIRERLGVGGAATVHRATWKEPTSGDVMQVALKRLHPHLADDALSTDAFLTEARVAAALDHRNICRFLDVGRLDDQLYIAMEYVHGIKLSTVLRLASRARRLPPIDVVVYLVCQLCDALHHAHTARDRLTGEPLEIVHRDVSPSNIIVTNDGELKLLDFGIAKSVCNQHQTKTGVIKGTLGYMPPEVVCGFAADWRADIFSAGVIAWELLCARPLFGGGKNEIAVYDRAFACHVPPPSSVNPACPPQLEAILMRALERMWLDRWSSAGEMADELRRFAAAHSLRPGMAAVAAWLGSLPKSEREIGEAEPRTDMECTAVYEAERDTRMTTHAWQRPVVELPRVPRAFPTGTGSTKTIERPARVVSAGRALPLPLPPPPRTQTEVVFRPDRMWWLLGAAMVAVAAASAWLANTTIGEPRHPLAAAAPPPPRPSAATADLSALVRPSPQRRRAATPARRQRRWRAARLARVPVHRLTPRRITWPRSSWSRARYRARVCLNRRGRVTGVRVLRGPRGLRQRIRHHLSLWRFAPYAPHGRAVRVCTVIDARIRPRRRR